MQRLDNDRCDQDWRYVVAVRPRLPLPVAWGVEARQTEEIAIAEEVCLYLLYVKEEKHTVQPVNFT